jgi:hypothetical protein
MDPETPPIFADIYQGIFDFCGALSLPAPWDFLAVDADCRGPISQPPTVLAALQKTFSDDQLVATGVAERVAEGLRLNPVLTNSEGAIVALRAEKAGKPFELLTVSGTLSGRDIPIFASMEDARTKELIASGNGLYVVSSIRDVALLRSARLAAATASGLGNLSPDALQKLGEKLGDGPHPSYLAMVKAMEEELAAERASLAENDELPGAEPGETEGCAKPSAVSQSAPDGSPPPPEREQWTDRPPLLLVGWWPLSLNIERPSWLTP